MRITRVVVPIIVAIALIIVVIVPAWASSHREAPLISNDPVADNTDVYMFRSPDESDTVTIIANYIPLEEPAGGPNFFKFGDDVLYQVHIYNDRDDKADITYQFRFKTKILNDNTFLYNTGAITSLDDPDFNIRQTYSVTRIKNGKKQVLGTNIPTPPCNVGPSSTPNYEDLAEQAITTLSDDSKVFAGQRDDGFFVDLGAVFDLLTIRKVPGDKGGGVDGVGGFNTHTISLQVPIEELTADGSMPTDPLDPNAVIGVYASASRQRIKVLRDGEVLNAGGFVQISRLGEPLINEVIIPLGAKDEWNASNPKDDQQFIEFYRDPEPARLINALFSIPVPDPPRDDIVAILLQGFSLEPLGIDFSNVGGPKIADLIRLNVAIEPKTPTDAGFSRFGILGNDLAGFPNGRRLQDDVTDIELRALAGATPFTPDFNVAPNNQLGDGVDENDVPFLDSFPYQATPHPGFEHDHHPVQPDP